MFKNKTVAEKFVAKYPSDIKINMKGYHGKLSEITPHHAAILAERNNPYIEPKADVKKKAEPGKE